MARHEDIAAELAAEITGGQYPPGSKLPTSAELAARFNTQENTITKAVRELSRAGLVLIGRGRGGTVVRHHPPIKRQGDGRYAKRKWRDEGVAAAQADRQASGQEWRPSDQRNTVRMTTADPETAEALGVKPGAAVVERRRLVVDGDTPTQIVTSYYRPDDVIDTPIMDPQPGTAGKGGGYAVLASKGLEPHRMRETTWADLPTPDEAKELRMPPERPVTRLVRTVRTEDGRVVEYATGVYVGDFFRWSYEFVIPD